MNGAAYDEMMVNLYDGEAHIWYTEDGDCIGYSFPDPDGVTVYRECKDSDIAFLKLSKMGFIF